MSARPCLFLEFHQRRDFDCILSLFKIFSLFQFCSSLFGLFSFVPRTAENPESAEGGLFIGAGSTLDTGTFFPGLIDDVRIYNRVVSL